MSEKKVRINVKTRFNLITRKESPTGVHQDADYRTFEVGIHEVDEATANHWYVKHHSELVDAAPVESEPPKKEAQAPQRRAS